MPGEPTPGDEGSPAEEAGALRSSRKTVLVEALALVTQARRC